MSDWQRRREDRYEETFNWIWGVAFFALAIWVVVKLIKFAWLFLTWCWG
jgi:hypothetical protein